MHWEEEHCHEEGKTAGKAGECRRLREPVVQLLWELGAASVGKLQWPGGLPAG